METETEALRRSAPSWSLAGDKKLLDTLQKVHETLLTKCNDTGNQLNAMCTALTDAALALDNVNNRFMSLSNSQFVERRVYDDDADVTGPAGDVINSQKSSEQPPTASEPATERIKRALKVLESTHETVVILADSDSDSGSEEDGDIDRVVLRPKDLYRDRPLPYIIGSKAWKSKWHAGVIPDPSGSESDQTNGSDREFEEYSDNERYSPSESVGRQVVRPAVRDQISSSSSEVISERDMPNAAINTQPLSPADIAAELARRLQGHQSPVLPPQPVMEESQPQEVPRKLYKPEKPAPGTIFPDEPPPLDSDHDDDIFAELRKSKPFVPSNKAQNSIAKDLFGVKGTEYSDGGSEEDDDIFNDFPPKAKNKPTPAEVKQSAAAYVPEKKPSEPLQSVAKTTKHESDEPSSTNKKPVGGISIFHGSQNSAIGAAILQRQRRAVSGDDTDGSDVVNALKQTIHKPESHKEVLPEKEKTHRDIFDDLFARSEKVIAKRKVDNDVAKESVVKKEEKKANLFSDNIFDDIDDIFTSDVIPQVPIKDAVTRDTRSLFDDDDDLFKDIITGTNTSAPKDNFATDNVTNETFTSKNKITHNESVTSKNIVKDNEAVTSKKASIFDSDDDFFNDKYPAPERKHLANKQSENINVTHNESVSNAIYSESKENVRKNSIFDSDELFAKMKSVDSANEAKSSQTKNGNAIEETISDAGMRVIDIFDNDEELFAENKSKRNPVDVAKAATSGHVKNETNSNTNKRTETIFVTDDDLFTESISYMGPKEATSSHVKSETASKENILNAIQRPKSIFEEYSDEKFFAENNPDTLADAAKGALSQVKYNQTLNIFNDIEPDDDIFVNTKSATSNEIIAQTEASEPNTDIKAKSKTTSSTKVDIFNDEENFVDDKYAEMKTEQTKRVTHESAEDLYKKYSNKETKVTTAANLDEQKVMKIMEENTIDDRARFMDNIMKPVDDVSQKFAKSKELSRDKLDIFKDEASFIGDVKTEQIKRGTHENADDLFKQSSTKETKEDTPDFDEQNVAKIIEEITIEDRARFMDNIMKPVDDVIQELESNTNNDFIESVLHSSDNTKNVNDEEFVPDAPEEISDEKLRRIENILSETEIQIKMGEHMKFDDILQEDYKDVPKTNISGNVKSELLRKPRAKIDLNITKNYNSKDTIPSNGEKINSLKIHEEKVDNMKVLDANKNITSDETSTTTTTNPTTTTIDTKQNTPDIFSEILNDVPPIFEKPKERKKSKNVNALFDDDSDDEALFYRKIDATLEDVPKIEKRDSPSDDRFKLFMNEPPAIDDFEHNVNSTKSVVNQHSCLIKNNQVSDDSDNNIYEKRHKVNRIFNKRDVASNICNDSDDELFTSKSESVKAEPTKAEINNASDSEEQQTPIKKIGKLKPTNLNINVNTLLPGALPKKNIKNLEQTDGQTVSSHSTEELHTKDTFDSKISEPNLIKTVSFDEDPDSTLLDNKLSKERARIKVKRRPSSRKARREASRKSGIDFGEDFTDNSNSIDDIPKSDDTNADDRQTAENKDDILDSIIYDSFPEDRSSKSDSTEADNNTINKDLGLENSNVDKKSNKPAVSKVNDDKKERKDCGHVMKECKCEMKTEHVPQASALKDVTRDQETLNTSRDVKHQETDTSRDVKKPQETDISINVVQKGTSETSKDAKQHQGTSGTSRDVKSKVVYILNDEDIFNDTKPQKSTEVLSKPKMLNIVDDDDDDDDIFKSITPANKVHNAEAKSKDNVITTLGNVYKPPTKKYDSDDDIFKDKQNIKSVSKPKEISQTLEKFEVASNDEILTKRETDVKIKPKSSIFDDLSDEENELFNSKQKTIPEKKLNKTILFDSDSDSELFSGKSKKGKEDTSAVRKKEINRVEVKGSLFGDDDDDDDIFGGKPKKTASSVISSSSSRNESEVKPQTSSSDPLSALLDQK